MVNPFGAVSQSTSDTWRPLAHSAGGPPRSRHVFSLIPPVAMRARLDWALSASTDREAQVPPLLTMVETTLRTVSSLQQV